MGRVKGTNKQGTLRHTETSDIKKLLWSLLQKEGVKVLGTRVEGLPYSSAGEREPRGEDPKPSPHSPFSRQGLPLTESGWKSERERARSPEGHRTQSRRAFPGQG